MDLLEARRIAQTECGQDMGRTGHQGVCTHCQRERGTRGTSRLGTACASGRGRAGWGPGGGPRCLLRWTHAFHNFCGYRE